MACQKMDHEEFISSKIGLFKVNDTSLSSFVFFINSSTHPQYKHRILKLCIITPESQRVSQPYKRTDEGRPYEKRTMKIEELEEETKNQCDIHNAMLPMRVCPELFLMGHLQRGACAPFLNNLSGNIEVKPMWTYIRQSLSETSNSSLGYILMELISPVYETLHFFDQYNQRQLLDRSLRVFALLISIFIQTKLCNTDAHFGNAFALKTWDNQVLDPIKIIDFGRVAHVDTYTPIDIDYVSHKDKFHAIAKKSKQFSAGLTHDYRVEGLTMGDLYRAIRHYVIIDYECTPDPVPKCIDMLMEVFPDVKKYQSEQYRLGILRAPDMFSDKWFGTTPEMFSDGWVCKEDDFTCKNLKFMLEIIQTQQSVRHEKVVSQQSLQLEEHVAKRSRQEPEQVGQEPRQEPRKEPKKEPEQVGQEPRQVSRQVRQEPEQVIQDSEQSLKLLSSALTDNQEDESRETVAPLTASITYKQIAGVGMFAVGCAVAYLMKRGGSKRKLCLCQQCKLKIRKTYRCKTSRCKTYRRKTSRKPLRKLL